MAYYQLDEKDAARSELAEGRKVIEAEFAGGLKEGDGKVGFWYDSLYAQILLREAVALIEGQSVPAKQNSAPIP